MSIGPISDCCETGITPEEWAEMQAAESVVIRKYEYADGTLRGEVVFIGDESEARDFAETPVLLILFAGQKSFSDNVVMVAELLPPMIDEERVADV